MEQRLKAAKPEIAAAKEFGLFDYVIVNNQLQQTLDQLLFLISSISVRLCSLSLSLPPTPPPLSFFLFFSSLCALSRAHMLSLSISLFSLSFSQSLSLSRSLLMRSISFSPFFRR